ncbi:MAG: hypothetical protein JSV65_17910, partial [Armatimonadota bacterium]
MNGALTIALICIILTAPGFGRRAACDALYTDDLRDIEAWRQMPDWLPNPSDSATLTRTADGARFSVPEAGRGMKWLRSVSRIWLDEAPWLVVRYRAGNVKRVNDYFIWLDAGDGVNALLLDQLNPDGQWHTLAADVSTLTAGDNVTAMALQVQAEAGDASVEIASIAFAETPPDDADIVGEQPPAREDWTLSEHVKDNWQPQPTWLGNPAANHSHERRDDTEVFVVADSHGGMKWALYCAEPVEPAGYRYLSLRIRGRGTVAAADYSICVLGDAAPDGQDYTVLAPSALAVTGGRWRTVDLPLGTARRHPRLIGLAVQAQAGDGPATLEIADVRLTGARRPVLLAESLGIKPGWPADATEEWLPVDLGSAATMTVDEAKRRFRLADWLPDERITIEAVPFHIRLAGKAVAATTMADESEAVIPLSGRASEVYLLALARFVGDEEHLRGGGRLARLDDPDRLRVILRYADGEERQALPLPVPAGVPGVEEGAQVLAVPADPTRDLEQLRLYIGTP